MQASMELLNNIIAQLSKDDVLLINSMAVVMLVFSAVTVLLLVISFHAPYGRYSSSNWGFEIPVKVAWVVQELPAFCTPVYLVLTTERQSWNFVNLALIAMFLGHYAHRYSKCVYITCICVH